MKERLTRLQRAFPDGDFPPITVNEMSGSFLVVDGHHRVAAARRRGIEWSRVRVPSALTVPPPG